MGRNPHDEIYIYNNPRDRHWTQGYFLLWIIASNSYLTIYTCGCVIILVL